MNHSIDASTLYTINEVNKRVSKRFNVNEILHHIKFTELAETQSNVIQTLLTALHHILISLTVDLHNDDRIQVTISNRGTLDYPIAIPFTRVKHLSIEQFFDEITKILQSNDTFQIGRNLEVRVVTVKFPRGGKGHQKRPILLQKWFEKNRSIVIVRNKDNLCLARAIGISLAKLLHLEFQTSRAKKIMPHWLTQGSGQWTVFLKK